ncbi:hypothetical protein [Brasilonema sp. UFV-L1]|uniref:COG1470 family protein n=1 Tax=Brasilonema sp. UFV-L1 TaxID=2234130 RepID=UPI00145F0516|nr:hypothetical protein [Brasilonema sp. UFV-L1]NMG10521.1 hypothetical protein [Brasilonema sp. UFV-L1]
MQQFIQNPLQVIIDPSGVQFGMPGDPVELHVTIINQGEQSAVIDLFLDEGLETLTRSHIFPRESLALDPQQSQQVTFRFEIPIDTLPGTYDYTLVVDSPNHYPQYTPINYPRQIKVLLKEQTVIRANDPTFSLQPATNPNKPLVFKFDEALQVEVTVHNRSNRVDRFRLNCPDLDDDWFTIIYPRTGAEGQGLSDVTALELLPSDRGQIRLELRPPRDIFAGNYSPTVRLHSENSPDLVLLELVYILVPTIYRLDVELNTILGQVSRSPGKYEVKLVNQGNTVRELMFSARTRDEEELCTYEYAPLELKLLPSKKAGVNLTVKPGPWWRRSLFGGGQVLNFQVDIKDKQDLPLSDTLPTGTLLWKARPWWQFLLLILVILGILGGLGYLIWRLLNPEPLRLENFQANAPQITEGDQVRLNWEIHNYKQLQKLVVIQTQPPRKEPILNNSLNELTAKSNAKTSPCVRQKESLICRNITTGVTKKDKYTFELKAYYRKNIPLIPQTDLVATKTLPVEILEKPIAKVVSFNTDKTEYRNGEKILFSWKIQLLNDLKRIEITDKGDDGTSSGAAVNYNFKQGSVPPDNIKKLCKNDAQNQQQTCTNVPYVVKKPGNFTFQLKAFSQGSDRLSVEQTQNKIKVLPLPLRIIYFRLNGSEEPSRVFKEGDILTIEWKVEGDKGTSVELSPPFGTVKELQGKRQITANQGLQSPIELKVSDPFGSPPQTKGFAFQINKPEPPATPSNTVTPIQPNNIPVP